VLSTTEPTDRLGLTTGIIRRKAPTDLVTIAARMLPSANKSVNGALWLDSSDRWGLGGIRPSAGEADLPRAMCPKVKNVVPQPSWFVDLSAVSLREPGSESYAAMA
jgi:hypothetical protein